MKIRHPPFIPPIKGGKVPSPLVGESLDEGCFRTKTKKTLVTLHSQQKKDF
jgi:hypothetical protein